LRHRLRAAGKRLIPVKPKALLGELKRIDDSRIASQKTRAGSTTRLGLERKTTST